MSVGVNSIGLLSVRFVSSLCHILEHESHHTGHLCNCIRMISVFDVFGIGPLGATVFVTGLHCIYMYAIAVAVHVYGRSLESISNVRFGSGFVRIEHTECPYACMRR